MKREDLKKSKKEELIELFLKFEEIVKDKDNFKEEIKSDLKKELYKDMLRDFKKMFDPYCFSDEKRKLISELNKPMQELIEKPVEELLRENLRLKMSCLGFVGSRINGKLDYHFKTISEAETA
jgi:hypothetical protein